MTRQVLIIEDDEDIATLVKLHLAELSCAVKLIRDGAAGLAEVGSKPYDLVVLDLMLPGVDGLEICRRVRANGRAHRANRPRNLEPRDFYNCHERQGDPERRALPFAWARC